jgi:hypothetical protein
VFISFKLFSICKIWYQKEYSANTRRILGEYSAKIEILESLILYSSGNKKGIKIKEDKIMRINIIEQHEDYLGMRELRNSIENFLFVFDELSDKYGFVKIYKTLRERYTKTSCFEDTVIHSLIGGLEDPDSTFYVQFMEEEKIKENAFLVKNIIDTVLLETLEFENKI